MTTLSFWNWLAEDARTGVCKGLRLINKRNLFAALFYCWPYPIAVAGGIAGYSFGQLVLVVIPYAAQLFFFSKWRQYEDEKLAELIRQARVEELLRSQEVE